MPPGVGNHSQIFQTMLNEPTTGSQRSSLPGWRPLISLVVAMTDQGVIGRGNALPWHLPADLKRFRALTLGKPILMGRKTFESIGRALPGRENLVLTHSGAVLPAPARSVGSLAQALTWCGESAELAVIGGAQVFALALGEADVIHLTRVHAQIDGDTYFPPLNPGEWQEGEPQEYAADEQHEFAMTFSTLVRTTPRA